MGFLEDNLGNTAWIKAKCLVSLEESHASHNPYYDSTWRAFHPGESVDGQQIVVRDTRHIYACWYLYHSSRWKQKQPDVGGKIVDYWASSDETSTQFNSNHFIHPRSPTTAPLLLELGRTDPDRRHSAQGGDRIEDL
jgi:hypothetical protein